MAGAPGRALRWHYYIQNGENSLTASLRPFTVALLHPIWLKPATNGQDVTVYKAPKTITTHPGVETCEDGDAEGMDYKHAVWLREGWQFKRGRMAGCRGGNFQTVEEFRFAEPVKV
jgi:hypothetical protein